MTKKIFIIVFLVILIPLSVSAFSFVNAFNFLKKGEILTGEETPAEPDYYQRNSALEKYENWKNAYEKQEIENLFLDWDNFVFAESEINYLIKKRLGDMDYPPVKDIKIFLSENSIKIAGESIKKFFSGEFELEISPSLKADKVVLEVKRARFRGFYFPAFVASFVINGELKETYDFLYSHPEYKKLEIKALSGYLELKYKK